MKLIDIFINRKRVFFLASFLLVLCAYITFKLIFPNSNIFIHIQFLLTYPVLNFIEKGSNTFLLWIGSDLTIHNHGILANGIQVEGFISQIMYKKITFFYLLLIWSTRSSRNQKIIFTGVFLVLGLFANVSNNIAGISIITSSNQNSYIVSATYCIIIICMNTTMLIWYRINKKYWMESHPVSFKYISLVENSLPDIIKVIYAYVIITFSLDYFDFSMWIDFILKSSQSILRLIGYATFLEDNILIGNYGSISMGSKCLGGMTMFLFAAVVFLTGNRQKKGVGFIILGLFILNIANIVRVVMVFVHLQKHGDYLLTTDIHDLYNYATYAIVFILWIIWFEKLFGAHSRLNLKLFPGKK